MVHRILNLIKSYRELSLFVVVLLIAIIGQGLRDQPAPSEPSASDVTSFDTYIPDGFSLVPIEVSNYETLDSLLGTYGVVDLFALDPHNPEKSRRIAYRVKILRAPKNPSHFAVLVPYSEVGKILKYPGPLMVSVQNPKATGTAFVKERSQKPSRIIFQSGG